MVISKHARRQYIFTSNYNYIVVISDDTYFLYRYQQNSKTDKRGGREVSIYRKECEMCGKTFFNKSKIRKYCCDECGKNARKNKIKTNDQPCWQCRKATGNCLWSSELKPIKGWDAKRVIVRDINGFSCRTYKIISCPQFVHD